MVCILKEAYLRFKEQNPEKFSSLFKVCRVMGKKVCMHTRHQNVKLISSAAFYDLTIKQVKPFDCNLQCAMYKLLPGKL
jgi:hypothetical protein